jgi:hypothetical protein
MHESILSKFLNSFAETLMRTLPGNKCGEKLYAISLQQNAAYYSHNGKMQLFVTLIKPLEI